MDMKRIFSSFMSFALVLSLFSVSVSAEETSDNSVSNALTTNGGTNTVTTQSSDESGSTASNESTVSNQSSTGTEASKDDKTSGSTTTDEKTSVDSETKVDDSKSTEETKSDDGKISSDETKLSDTKSDETKPSDTQKVGIDRTHEVIKYGVFSTIRFNPIENSVNYIPTFTLVHRTKDGKVIRKTLSANTPHKR